MTSFEQFISTYFISVTALAGFAVLWRNWLEDHLDWKEWMRDHLGVVSRSLTCGSCFTLWFTLFFVIAFHPLSIFFEFTSFASLPVFISYPIQWMSLGWGALFLRFLYVAIQESVSILVHRFKEHSH
jgi:hypothetical protein